MLLLQQHEYREAADRLQSAVRALPDFAPAHNALGIALASSGDLDQAVKHFERAVALDPEFAEGRRNLDLARQQRPGQR
jgi:tetratricopeptide (TPR) repeat protein